VYVLCKCMDVVQFFFSNRYVVLYILPQAKKMVASTRIIATSVYVTMMALTLFLVFYGGYIPLRLMFIVFAIACQFAALVWYTMTFIPFAREIITQMCCKCGDGYSWV
jgi:hypothetical protein